MTPDLVSAVCQFNTEPQVRVKCHPTRRERLQKLRAVGTNSVHCREIAPAWFVLTTMYNRAAMALKREGGEMPSLEERVAYLEGRLEDHTRAVDDLTISMGGLRGEFGELRADVHNLREQMDRRFEAIDRRFESIDRRFESVDGRFEDVGGRFDALDQKIDRHFTWLVGIQVAALVAVVGALVGSFYR